MISVVTPSFRQPRWLRLCSASVADQAGPAIEHIIQDGGTEGISIANIPYLSQRPNYSLQLFVESDRGMYEAINRGLKRGRGEICAYLNCDEQYLPGTLQRVNEYFRAHPSVEVLMGDALIVDAQGRALTYRRAIAPTRRHLRASHLNIYSCSTFFRRSVIEAGHLLAWEWKSIGDTVWIDGMLASGISLAVLPELLSVFTLTGENLSTTNAVSEEEKKRWQTEMGDLSALAQLTEVVGHRVRKLLAGAYCKRTFDYEIYTLQSPEKRVRFRAEAIGGTWPGGSR